MAHAEGTFTVRSWDESTYQELAGAAKLTRARMVFGYEGGLRAEGTSDTLMCYGQDGTAVYTGLDRMVGQLDGRPGSFVLLSRGAYSGGEARTAWQVVEGSGTGELAGLRGTGSAVAASGPGGTFSLEYELG
ncbi:MAG: DUF3224 domain-containing protein [Streptosporangiaceae bacterium]